MKRWNRTISSLLVSRRCNFLSSDTVLHKRSPPPSLDASSRAPWKGAWHVYTFVARKLHENSHHPEADTNKFWINLTPLITVSAETLPETRLCYFWTSEWSNYWRKISFPNNTLVISSSLKSLSLSLWRQFVGLDGEIYWRNMRSVIWNFNRCDFCFSMLASEVGNLMLMIRLV